MSIKEARMIMRVCAMGWRCAVVAPHPSSPARFRRRWALVATHWLKLAKYWRDVTRHAERRAS